MYIQILEAQAPKVLGKRIDRIDFGDCVKSREDRDALMNKLVHEDLLPQLKQLLASLKKFVGSFENY